MNYLETLIYLQDKQELTAEEAAVLKDWYHSYTQAVQKAGHDINIAKEILGTFLKLLIQEHKSPTQFDSYHRRMTSPIDYYRFGLDFTRPLIMLQKSTVNNIPCVDQIQTQLKQGENVVLLANHQTELDPQVISILLERSHPRLAEEMIFVAGHRVVNDPIAIPFSKGRNLLCIFSKKYIENDLAKKEMRLQHNQRTMKQMSELLSEGGQCIYVAPSGGRDRPDSNGVIRVAPFDPQSIEMFWLMAQRAKRKTHFYPLALKTYQLLPPPDNVKKSLGEPRHTAATDTHIAFGNEIDMDHFPGSDQLDKKQRRQQRADFIWSQVEQMYHHFI